MSDSQASLPSLAHQTVLEHLTAGVEHIWAVVQHMAASTPGAGLGTPMFAAREVMPRLEAARAALASAGTVIADAERGDLAAARVDATSAGREAEGVVYGSGSYTGSGSFSSSAAPVSGGTAYVSSGSADSSADALNAGEVASGGHAE